MMPPECRLCGLDLRSAPAEQFEQVQFQLTPEQQAAEAHRAEGWMGHPPGLAWFCRPHAELARQHTGLTEDEALRTLRAQLG